MYIIGGWERGYFFSYKYKVTVIKINNTNIKLRYERENANIVYNGDTITITGNLPLSYAVVIKSIVQDNETIIFTKSSTVWSNVSRKTV